MRISDWSSDVCSSDLLVLRLPFGLGAGEQLLGAAGEAAEPDRRAAIGAETADALHRDDAVQPRLVARVERVAAAKNLGHAIAVGLRQAVADDDLVGAARLALVVAIDDDLVDLFVRRAFGLLRRGGQGGGAGGEGQREQGRSEETT